MSSFIDAFSRGRIQQSPALAAISATFLKNVLIGSRGSLALSPNDAIARAIEQLPLEPDIGEPLWVSELSCRPGYIYDSLDGFDGREDRELRLYLAEDEYNRMILLDLRPEEVRQLHDRHGIFFEIHADFYEPVSYAAVQPKTRYLKRKAEAALMAGNNRVV